MKLTKQQLDALNRRLDTIIDKKVTKLEATRQKVWEYIRTHELKARTAIDTPDLVCYGYDLDLYYEVDGLAEYVRECRNKAAAFRQKLNEAKKESIDNMILYGTDVEEFIKSFESIQP